MVFDEGSGPLESFRLVLDQGLRSTLKSLEQKGDEGDRRRVKVCWQMRRKQSSKPISGGDASGYEV